MVHVLITGAAGFLGSHLALRLLKGEYAVIGVDDLSHGTLENLSPCLPFPHFTFYQQDVLDKNFFRGLNDL